MRAYLRQRAGLPPVTTGTSALNRGHLSLFERELLFLHDVLPKDSEVHDGLQLVDGGNPSRHCIPQTAVPGGSSDGGPGPAVTSVAPQTAVLGGSSGEAPGPAATSVATLPAVVPVVAGAAPIGVVLPVPSQPMRLEPLPAHLTGRAAPHVPANGTPHAVRHDERVGIQDEEEEEEEIRPVRDNRSAQWRAYRAAGF